MLLKSQTKQVNVLQCWNLSLSKRSHTSTITKLQEPFMNAAETLKRECQLEPGISPMRRASTDWHAASCLSGINNPRDRLRHQGLLLLLPNDFEQD